MTRIDEGHFALEAVIKKCESLNLADANEAETRLKIIDEILFAVLGWTKEDTRVEERISEDGQTEFADYIVKTVSSSFLVEAKKIGATFGLPINRKGLKLGGVLSEGEIGKAIRQARDYCRKKSIPFAVVTNGASWVIFPAVRTDGVEFENSEARLFKNLNEVLTRFVEFWELLSRQRVLDGNLETELLGKLGHNEIPRVLRQSLVEPGYRLGRNSLYDHIEPAITAALSDEALLENSEALMQCYVKTSERLKYDNRLQMQLKDTMPPLGHPVTRVKNRKYAGILEDKIKKLDLKTPPRFITVLGPVGAGKTTFLHHVRKISASGVIDNKIMWFIIDFKKASPHESAHEFIFKELLNGIDNDSEFMLGDWFKSIQPAYQDYIEALKRGSMYLIFKNDLAEFERTISKHITSDRDHVDPYVTKILGYAAKKIPGFLIIDNVDQIEDQTMQETIFLEAQSLARKIGFNVIMSMRETTYLKHRDSPTFDAFQYESLYIDAPNIIPVLGLRLGYAKSVLSGRPALLKTERGMSIQVPDLGIFFDVVSKSLLDSEAGLLIECLSGGNIRRGLSLIREFLSSGHTNSDRAIAAYLKDGEYKFPKHEIFKGAVLGSFKFFNDGFSLLPNLFDSKLNRPVLQLLRIRIVYKSLTIMKDQPELGISFDDIAPVLNRIGVSEDDLCSTLNDLTTRGFLKTGDGLSFNKKSILFPTRLAGFSIKQLCKQFSYAEFCCMDTTIFNNDIWSELMIITNQIEGTQDVVEKIFLRSDRLEMFFRYLILAEEQWVVECKRRDLPNEWQNQIIMTDFWPEVRKDAETAILSAILVHGNLHNLRKLPNRHGKIGDFSLLKGVIEEPSIDKEYVFIKCIDGNRYFAHKAKFVSGDDWNYRFKNDGCEFYGINVDGKLQSFFVKVKQC